MERYLFVKEKSNVDVLCYVGESKDAYLEFKIKLHGEGKLDGPTEVFRFEGVPAKAGQKVPGRVHAFAHELNVFKGLDVFRWKEEVAFEVSTMDELKNYLEIRRLLKL